MHLSHLYVKLPVSGTVHVRGSQSLQNLVAIFQRYNQPVLTSTAGCMGKDGKIGYSIQRLVAKVKDTVANG